MDTTNNEEEKLTIKKLRTAIVNTAMGKRTITMVPFSIDKTKNLLDVICTSSCPYGKLCGKIRNPEALDDKEQTFTDWCVKVSFKGDDMRELSDLSSYYPQEGELEKLYPENHESLKQLIDQKELINLSQFIDNVCPGFCDKYSPNHENCSFNNPMCICRELFIKIGKPLVLNENSEVLEQDQDKEG